MLRRHSVVTTSAGKSAAELECHAEGDKPISVTWKKVSKRASRSWNDCMGLMPFLLANNSRIASS